MWKLKNDQVITQAGALLPEKEIINKTSSSQTGPSKGTAHLAQTLVEETWSNTPDDEVAHWLDHIIKKKKKKKEYSRRANSLDGNRWDGQFRTLHYVPVNNKTYPKQTEYFGIYVPVNADGGNKFEGAKVYESKMQNSENLVTNCKFYPTPMPQIRSKIDS
ncbi:hypothetical protein DFH08DRAFT_814434 [Mycena albidolilacea]|uniref:Uncharacterized protein n=1 Tax=Mycena albidolilacea TaxID=1033008 RepID=A0AAD7EK16_9AGAR|nr:hypothetical protein DFH08DRAFT_814434 [Mycena albidolilacea]